MPKKANPKAAAPAKPSKASKEIKKDPKTEKKAAPPKGKAAAKTNEKLLELGLLCDCTSSMWSWIDRAKKTLQEIISNVTSSTDGLKVRVSFIGYRDHCDAERFSIQPFSDDIAKVRDFISNVRAMGGGDLPEDVVGGLRKCLD
jgi:hypothetical protein